MAKQKTTIEQILSKLQDTGGNQTKAAKELNINPRTLSRKLSKYRNSLKRHEFNEPTVSGVSALQRGDENEPLKWVKYKRSDESQRQMLNAFAEGLKDTLTSNNPIPSPKISAADFLNCFFCTDYHLGMYAWHEECGEDWNIKIAEDLIIRWFMKAIESAPQADTAILAQLGDFLHFDGLEAVTPQHGHILDADTRFQLLVRSAIRIVRTIIDELLTTHKNVHVIMALGNHDQASSAWLRELLHTLYEKEPRVTVDRSADSYYSYEFDNVSLFFHHGHRRTIAQIDSVLAAKFRSLFGRTDHSYAHLGHLHNSKILETNLMIVEQHPTLAAKDAYASHGGWMSKRSAKVITYHRQNGKCAEITISPEML